MTFSVVFTPEAEEQLVDLYRYIAAAGSPEAAARYTDSIVTFCEELATFPHQGRAREETSSRGFESSATGDEWSSHSPLPGRLY